MTLAASVAPQALEGCGGAINDARRRYCAACRRPGCSAVEAEGAGGLCGALRVSAPSLSESIRRAILSCLRASNRGTTLVQIVVRENNVDQALKALKKKMQREGTFREMKRRNHFEKPSEKRAREEAEAVRRMRKLQRKRAQREGLVLKR